jgi:ABC-type microcin C transport system permease subunit YejE
VWFISLSIGTILGGIMGFFGGKVDFIGQRFVEILSTVPSFFLLIILISIFAPSLWMLIFISCIFSWINISYYVRAEFLKNRNREFVEAARALGASNGSIIFKHILPIIIVIRLLFLNHFSILVHASISELDFTFIECFNEVLVHSVLSSFRLFLEMLLPTHLIILFFLLPVLLLISLLILILEELVLILRVIVVTLLLLILVHVLVIFIASSHGVSSLISLNVHIVSLLVSIVYIVLLILVIVI